VKDTLSEILRGLRLKGGIFLDARFTAPWCVISHITPEDCQNLLSDPHDFVCLHYVVSGKVYVGVGEGERMEVNEGELVLVPRNDAHMSLLVRTNHYTYCPYEGDCTYYSGPIGGSKSEYAVWTYEKPYEAVASIKEHLAFYPPRVDAIEVIS